MRADLRWGQVNTKRGRFRPIFASVSDRMAGPYAPICAPAHVTTTLGAGSAKFGPFPAMLCAPAQIQVRLSNRVVVSCAQRKSRRSSRLTAQPHSRLLRRRRDFESRFETSHQRWSSIIMLTV